MPASWNELDSRAISTAKMNVSEMDTREQRFLLLPRRIRSTSITFALTRQTHTGWAAIVSFFHRATLH